jgi:methyl halide transferase
MAMVACVQMKPYVQPQPWGRRVWLSSASALLVWTAPALVMLLMTQSSCAAQPQTKAEPERSEAIDPALVERWDARYQHGSRPSWDTGRTSTELQRLVEQGVLRPCRVLELGCGTGVNAVYLAKQGFEVIAIDVAPTALKLAQERANEAGVRVQWVQADVLAPPPLGSFDLIFDRGCYHGVRQNHPSRYVEVVQRLCRPGGHLLILAGNANEPGQRYGPPRVDEKELVNDFASGFDFELLREIRFDTAEAAAQGALAWVVLLRRTADPGTAP